MFRVKGDACICYSENFYQIQLALMHEASCAAKWILYMLILNNNSLCIFFFFFLLDTSDQSSLLAWHDSIIMWLCLFLQKNDYEFHTLSRHANLKPGTVISRFGSERALFIECHFLPKQLIHLRLGHRILGVYRGKKLDNCGQMLPERVPRHYLNYFPYIMIN